MCLHTVVKVTPQMLLPSKTGTAHLGIMLYIVIYIMGAYIHATVCVCK